MLEDQIKKLVSQTLKISEDRVNEDLAAGDIPEWDSLGHATLLQAVESEFNIALDVGDAIGIESFGDLVAVVGKYVDSSTRA